MYYALAFIFVHWLSGLLTVYIPMENAADRSAIQQNVMQGTASFGSILLASIFYAFGSATRVVTNLVWLAVCAVIYLLSK